MNKYLKWKRLIGLPVEIRQAVGGTSTTSEFTSAVLAAIDAVAGNQVAVGTSRGAP
jgi:hypothetical protein